jgi:hypothetical protein
MGRQEIPGAVFAVGTVKKLPWNAGELESLPIKDQLQSQAVGFFYLIEAFSEQVIDVSVEKTFVE